MGERDFNNAPVEPSELDYDKRFQLYFSINLEKIIMDRKFGKQFLNEHFDLSRKKLREEAKSKVKNDGSLPEYQAWINPDEFDEGVELWADLAAEDHPVIPEIGQFRRKLLGQLRALSKSGRDLKEILDFCKQENIDFIEEDVNLAKKEAFDFLAKERGAQSSTQR